MAKLQGYRERTISINIKSLLLDGKKGSGVLNPGAVFLRFVTVAFLLFLAPVGGPNPAGPIF